MSSMRVVVKIYKDLVCQGFDIRDMNIEIMKTGRQICRVKMFIFSVNIIKWDYVEYGIGLGWDEKYIWDGWDVIFCLFVWVIAWLPYPWTQNYFRNTRLESVVNGKLISAF